MLHQVHPACVVRRSARRGWYFPYCRRNSRSGPRFQRLCGSGRSCPDSCGSASGHQWQSGSLSGNTCRRTLPSCPMQQRPASLPGSGRWRHGVRDHRRCLAKLRVTRKATHDCNNIQHIFHLNMKFFLYRSFPISPACSFLVRYRQAAPRQRKTTLAAGYQALCICPMQGA